MSEPLTLTGPSGDVPRGDVARLGARAEHADQGMPAATGIPPVRCDGCGRPSAGIMCEPCLRYELVRPGRLLAYTSGEVDELAEAADAAARFWTGIAAWLRTEAARRAE